MIKSVFEEMTVALTATVSTRTLGQAAQSEGDFALGSYCELAEDAVANITELRGEMTRLAVAENVGAVEQLMRDVR